jgi:hypothetical protein
MKLIITEFSDRVEYRNKKGQLHNDDGPAISWNDGTNEYWENGEPVEVVKRISDDYYNFN